LFCSEATLATRNDDLFFDDQPLKEDIVHPQWFKVSFLELQDDLIEARKSKKRGLIIYFGQKRCPYCKARLENNWGRKDILAYTLENFDVIGINVRVQKQLTGFDGKEYTEKTWNEDDKPENQRCNKPWGRKDISINEVCGKFDELVEITAHKMH
jgi:hypothetical protein